MACDESYDPARIASDHPDIIRNQVHLVSLLLIAVLSPKHSGPQCHSHIQPREKQTQRRYCISYEDAMV